MSWVHRQRFPISSTTAHTQRRLVFRNVRPPEGFVLGGLNVTDPRAARRRAVKARPRPGVGGSAVGGSRCPRTGDSPVGPLIEAVSSRYYLDQWGQLACPHGPYNLTLPSGAIVYEPHQDRGPPARRAAGGGAAAPWEAAAFASTTALSSTCSPRTGRLGRAGLSAKSRSCATNVLAGRTTPPALPCIPGPRW